MSDLDFTRQAKTGKAPTYDPAVALEFFSLGGKPEDIAQGATIFAENERSSRLLLKRDKMYLLVEGEVSLVARNKIIGTIGKGEIFGEMAFIAHTPRSATAVATRACRIIALDDKEFRNALRKMPEFALMLMSVMVGRVRETASRLQGTHALGHAAANESSGFDRSMLANLKFALGDDSTVQYERGKIIMQEGQAGALMYVVLQGRVTITMQGNVVDRVGTGGVFGEMALIEWMPRLATATAETDCTLLAINRNMLLNLVRGSPDFGVALLGVIGERARFLRSVSDT